MARYIVQYSGGITSYWAARRVVEQYGKENVLCLFADVVMEDEDCYRFIDETIADLECEFVTISDGRNPYHVFKDERFLGNSRVDMCSRILKREKLRAWILEHCNLQTDVVVYGLDWTEGHRLEKVKKLSPWTCLFPLTEAPYWLKSEMLWRCRHERGIEPPRLYDLGFAHNNCGGGCVKAGQAQWALLLKTMPERYAWHEDQENQVRELIGKDHTILRLREKGKVIPITLKEFRLRVQGNDYDLFDWGGCGCAL